MLIFRLCFVLYFLKLWAGIGFYASAHRKNESSEQREKRLAYARGKHMSFEERQSKREKHCEHERAHRRNESSEQGIKD